MPYKNSTLWIGLLGLLALAVLLLFGRNLDRAASTGPRWKRRLVAAGMMLLAGLGLMPGCRPEPKQESAKPTGQQKNTNQTLSAKPAQRQVGARLVLAKQKTGLDAIADVYHRAEAIAAGKKGPYPFDRAGKKKILADLDDAMVRARRLESAEKITRADADLLVTELGLLKKKVMSFRPTEMKNATCYEPGRMRPYDDTKERLSKRLQVLEHMDARQKLNPKVVRLVRARMERDLAKMEKLSQGRPIPAKDKNILTKAKSLWHKLLEKVGARKPQPR